MVWLKNLIGAGLVGTVWAATAWWTSAPPRTPHHQIVYDMCLVQHAGNTVACDALTRLLAVQEAKDGLTKDQALEMKLNGSSPREIVEWVTAQGLVGADVAGAAGISLKDLQAGKY